MVAITTFTFSLLTWTYHFYSFLSESQGFTNEVGNLKVQVVRSFVDSHCLTIFSCFPSNC